MCRKATWSAEDKLYLQDNWGTKSKQTIAKNLGRTVNAIEVMKNRLGLGAFLENSDYVTWNQFQKALGLGRSGSGYKMKSWVKNRNFPLHTKKVHKNSFKIVYISEFWKWAELNKDFLDFSKLERMAFGCEPAWVQQKRRSDIEKNKKYITTPWTKEEDKRLTDLLKQYRYTYHELSKMLKRTSGAIQKRICDLNLRERPLKVDNHIKWTDKEKEELIRMIEDGHGYEIMSERIGKSSKAIRGRVYSYFGTENLDKVRITMKKGA